MISPNSLYQCDCLLLLERVDSACITLAYLDPPWYEESTVGLKWEQAKESRKSASENTKSFQDYLNFVSKVLQQSRRILTETGSVYIHLEPRLSSHARLLLDQIFGRENFQTEFILPCHRSRKVRHLFPQHEVILLYSKSDKFIYNPPKRVLGEEEIREKYNFADEKGSFRLSDLTLSLARPNLVYEWNGLFPPAGRSWKFTQERMQELYETGTIYFSQTGSLPALKTYASESIEVELGNIWDDLPAFPRKAERADFAKQRPVELLKRIILAGSNEGDTVLDPFCGSGTALVAAQANDRKWIGCDISQEVYSISLKRMEENFGLTPGGDFVVGNQAEVTKSSAYKNAYASLITGLENFARESTQPIVYVEGKTDRDILLAAWDKLYGKKSMPFGIKDCNPLSENSNNVAAGASILAKFIGTVRADNPHVAIGVFDRDKEGSDEYRNLPKYFTEIAEIEAKVSENRKGAAFLLPIPPGKELYAEYLNFSIEFYFSEAALSQTTSEGWGLKFRYPKIETKIRRYGNPIIRVEPSTITETREIIEGKTTFAERIVPQLSPAEFQPFRVLFDQIQELLRYLD